MFVRVLRWIIHWFGQGLKLWMFAFLGYMLAFPITLLLQLFDVSPDRLGEMSLVGKIGVWAGFVTVSAVGIAVFTAVLASQLDSNPLRSPKRKKRKKTNVEKGKPAAAPELHSAVKTD